MILTFEKIRELYWNEKDSQKLQELPKNFFEDVADYLKKREDENIRSVVMDLINRRNRKVLNMALSHIKTKTYPSGLTEKEKILFEDILNSLKNFRTGIFTNIDLKEEAKKTIETKNEKDGFVVIKESLPCFIGPDMKTYRLKKGDKVYLPKDLRELLIKNDACSPICD